MQDQNSFIDVNNENGIGADLDEVYASNRKRVLVIEDEPETVFLLKHILRSAGYNVLGAYSGKEALKKFSEVKPNLVLLDSDDVWNGWLGNLPIPAPDVGRARDDYLGSYQ